MKYKVKIEQFEGPLDVLLSLIEEQKMDITRISLAHITDEYLEYINNREQVSLSSLADFLTIAAKLLLIKSKALLPILEFSKEEESSIEELEMQLEALRVIKDTLPEFRERLKTAKPFFARKGMWGLEAQFIPPKNISPNDLRDAFLTSLNAIPQLDELEQKAISDIVSLEKKITQIHEIVTKKVKVAFSSVVKNAKDPSDVIVSFLALLELVKQKLVIANQKEVFEEIELERVL